MADAPDNVIAEAWLDEIPRKLLVGSHMRLRSLYRDGSRDLLLCLFRNHEADGRRNGILRWSGTALWPRDAPEGESPIYALTYVMAGTGELTLRGERTAVRAGDVFQLNGVSNRDFSLRSIDGLIECAVCAMYGAGERMAQQQIWDRAIVHGHIGRQPALAKRFVELFGMLQDAAVDPGALLRALVSLLDVAYAAHADATVERRFMHQARRVLAADSGPQSTVRDVARSFRMSESQFHRMFRRLCGTTPRAFQLQARMERACGLLLAHSVKETAALLGYTDQFFFSRQFKRRFGIAPSNFFAERGMRPIAPARPG